MLSYRYQGTNGGQLCAVRIQFWFWINLLINRTLGCKAKAVFNVLITYVEISYHLASHATNIMKSLSFLASISKSNLTMNLFHLILNPYSFYIVHKLSNLPTISFLQSHVRCFKPLHSSFEMKRFHSSGCELTMGRFRLLLFLGSAASRQFIINIM